MLTTHRLGRLAGAGALSTLLLLAACEQSGDVTSPSSFEAPPVGMNTTQMGYAGDNLGKVYVCQFNRGDEADADFIGEYSYVTGDGGAGSFSITGSGTILSDYPPEVGGVPNAGCALVYEGDASAFQVTLESDVLYVSPIANRWFTESSFGNFGNNATSPPKPVSDTQGLIIWYKFDLEDTPDRGIEGCTPGYWKQEQHFDSWPVAYSPGTLFEDVFAATAAVADDTTLLDALEAKGGGVNALLRHATAALLNAGSGFYPYTTGEVISMVNDALTSGEGIEDLKDDLDAANNLGCPLN